MDEKPDKIFGNLYTEVIKPGFCTGCGACVASCQFDALSIVNHEPKPIGKCERCNFCYYECPQTGAPAKLMERVFGQVSSDPDIGVYEEALSVKTKDPKIRKKCQDGGAVTSMLTWLLKKDFIDGAVVMGFDGESWKPEPKVALTRDEIIQCAGTKYTPGPILLGLRDAVDLYSKERIAIVGTPCQINAVRRMQFGDRAFYHLADSVKLVIGLFCIESFNYEKLKKFVKRKLKIPIENVSKFDIKKGNFVVYSKQGSKREVDLKALKNCINTSCSVCSDSTCELADISVGAVGSPLGRSTVLVRTEVGAEAFKMARSNPKLGVKSLDSVKPGIGLVKRLARRKKNSAEKLLKRRKKYGKPILPWMAEKKLGDESKI